MTISQSLIEWLKEYNPIAIDTDRQSDKSMTYALAKEPIVNIKRYLSGKREVSENYLFTARLESQMNTDRIDNGAWFEGLERWVEEQYNLGNLPNVEGVRKVSVTSSFYVGMADAHTSVYQVGLEIIYTVGD